MSGSLGFNDSRQDARSTSTSNSYGYTSGVSADTSRSSSQALSEGVSSSDQTIAFEDLYRQLYGGATQAASSVAMQAPQLQAAAQQLFTGGTQFLQTLGGNAGTNYMEDRLNGNNDAVDAVVESLKTDAASLFTDKLNPAITSRAVANGTLGGGRQGVAQGVAQGEVADSFLRNAANVRMADIAQKDQIAANIANNSVASASTGLGALPGLLDIAERGNNAELASYSSLAQILGGPTTLTSSRANNFSQSTSQAIADAFSRSFGEQTAQSESKSRAKGHAWGFDTSFSYLGGTGG